MLSVVVPVYNEAGTIGDVLGRLAALPFVTEVVVVDDGSTDGTRERLRTLAGPKVELVLLPRNRGKGAAVREGIRRVRGIWLVVQDADLEYDPADLERLLVPLREGRAGAVYGSRYLGRPESEAWHTLANRWLTLLSNLLTGLHLTDMETCYKVLPAATAKRLPLRSEGFAIEPELTALLARRGLRIAELPVSYRQRGYAAGKKIGWKDAFRAVAVMLRCALSR